MFWESGKCCDVPSLLQTWMQRLSQEMAWRAEVILSSLPFCTQSQLTCGLPIRWRVNYSYWHFTINQAKVQTRALQRSWWDCIKLLLQHLLEINLQWLRHVWRCSSFSLIWKTGFGIRESCGVCEKRNEWVEKEAEGAWRPQETSAVYDW